MARDHGRVLIRIWSDKSFCARSVAAQRLYLMLISRREINNAGIIPMMIRKWSRASPETTEDDIRVTLIELCEHGYIAMDEETEEVLVRSFMRNDGVVKQPNILKNALKLARQIESPKLRHILASELRKIGMKITSEVADEIDPKPFANPSRTLLSAVDNPAESVDTETLREPFVEPRGEGEGVGEGVSPYVGGQVSSAPAQILQEERPQDRCDKHTNNPSPPKCRACREARLRTEEWDAKQWQRKQEIARELERARADSRTRCEHGTDAGAYPHPSTGLPVCALCRAAAQEAS